jgi:excisionase family DNA binding protein
MNVNDNKIVVQLVTTKEELLQVYERLIKAYEDRQKEEEAKNENASIEYLTVEEVAKLFQVSTTTVHKWKNDGILPFIKIKSRVRFEKSAVINLFKSQKRKSYGK